MNDFYVTAWDQGNCGHAHRDIVSAWECRVTQRPDLPDDRGIAYIDPQGEWHTVHAWKDSDDRLMYQVM